MGGKAFAAMLLESKFPRMSHARYNALKAQVLERLQPLYGRVGVPREAPQKADYGDLDFIVVDPVDGLTHDKVTAAVGAEHSIVGNTSNFAVPSTLR